MCGIAGSINHKLDISLLTRDLWHRGPDEQSTFQEDNLQLHHHRLSILDIAGGKQPMHYEHLTIIFNGEIYNHLEVREKRGLRCQTNSDTETILHAYASHGPDCFNDFDGMFALAIFDRKKQALFLARDRAGKKPLYYFTDGRKFLFASELNALVHQLPLQIDEEHLNQYMRMGYFYKTSTAYKDVWELAAGSYAYVSLQKPVPEQTKWWDIHNYYLQRSTDDFENALEKTDAILHKAIKNRVESSDLEVGSFLSGGIDSGLVTAIAKSYNSSLKTFTISFDGDYDEAPLARLVAEKYETQHTEIRISMDNLMNDVEKIVANYGEPFFDSSAIPSYYISQEAKKHVTVILNGDGGDEMFGGYRRYVPFARYDFFNPGIFIKTMAKAAHAVLPVSHDKKSRYNFIYRLTDLAGKSGLETYLAATLEIFAGYEKYLVGNKSVLAQVENDFSVINRSKLTGLQKIMNLDFDNILAGDLLVKMDIATMAHSQEGRSPLLAKEILEYVPSLPDRYKVQGTQTKYLLRQLAKRYLPAELIHQPKRGFEIPLKKWINNELKTMIADYLLSPSALCYNYISRDFVRQLIDNSISIPAEKRAKMLWLLFTFEVWYRKVYKNG